MTSAAQLKAQSVPAYRLSYPHDFENNARLLARLLQHTSIIHMHTFDGYSIRDYGEMVTDPAYPGICNGTDPCHYAGERRAGNWHRRRFCIAGLQAGGEKSLCRGAY